MKTYSPVQVRNPTSAQHVVKVRAGQSVHLHLDLEMFDNPTVETDGYLSLLSVEKVGNKNVYHISHPLDVHGWSEYSHTQLGEVWIISDSIVSKMQVILETRNPMKQNHITIINPQASDFRIKPYHIFEVVVFDTSFTSANEEWSWEWEKGADQSIFLDFMGKDDICHYMWNHYYGYLDEDDPDYRYSSCLRVETPAQNPTFKQHHFWFRMGGSVMASLDKGTTRVGRLVFEGIPCRWKKTIDSKKTVYGLDLYVDLSPKYRNQVITTLRLAKKGDYSPFSYKHQTGQSQLGTSRETVRSYTTKKKKQKQRWEPVRRKVIVNKMDVTFLAEGCRVLSSSPKDDTYGHKHNDCWEEVD